MDLGKRLRATDRKRDDSRDRDELLVRKVDKEKDMTREDRDR